MAFNHSFCNSPWYEYHINWDGSLGYCCAQEHFPPYENTIENRMKYNIEHYSIREWYNSDIMKQARLQFNKEERNPNCNQCWKQEETLGTSRRYKSNQKSVIFQKENFKDSYIQSPGNKHFEHSFNNDGDFDGMPIDFHIDFGNHCNLACKFCEPQASSKIAAQYNRWGILEDKRLLKNNWTADDNIWNNFLDELVSIPNLKNIHLQGGETLLSKRFRELVDRFDQEQKYDVCFSFVSNGTIFDKALMDKLAKFSRVGIEISIETLTEHNEYIRQGTKNEEVISNIKKFNEYFDGDKITVTLRPALSLLSLKKYYTLLEFALENKLLIKSLPIIRPEHLQTHVLPYDIRQTYKQEYLDFIKKHNLDQVDISTDFNESDWHHYDKGILIETNHVLAELDRPDHPNQAELFKKMLADTSRWDTIYGLSMKKLYPEFNL